MTEQQQQGNLLGDLKPYLTRKTRQHAQFLKQSLADIANLNNLKEKRELYSV